jgi:hypothetical protein
MVEIGKPRYRLAIVLQQFRGSKNLKPSRCFSLFDHKPFDIEKIMRIIIKALEECDLE